MNSISQSPTLFSVIPCAGVGRRASSDTPKQYRMVAGKPLVAHTIAALLAVPEITAVIVVLSPDDSLFAVCVMPLFQAAGNRLIVSKTGGKERNDSVAAGLDVAQSQLQAHPFSTDLTSWVMVHDAARCLITPEQVQRLIKTCWELQTGAILALPVSDTLKQADLSGNRIQATVERGNKWLAQTPQMFPLTDLIEAIKQARTAQVVVTDEASAVESVGYAPVLVENYEPNFKVTFPHDFALAEQIIQSRQAVVRKLRIGQGWDVHRLIDAQSSRRQLILGGVLIPFDKALLGHSDADVLLHAITDAILGAAGLGDIGRMFPDTDAQWAGADSSDLLKAVATRVAGLGYTLGNVDATIIAQAPKLMPYMPQICAAIAVCLAPLGATLDSVNVKAKTAEKLGPVGQGMAMEASASVRVMALMAYIV